MNIWKLTIVCMAMLAFVVGGARADDKVKISIGTDGFVHLPLFVAYDAGLFKKQGLDVEIVKFKGGGAAMSGLAGGSVDMCSCSVQNAINASAKGVKVKLIGVLVDQYASNVVVTEKTAEKIGLTATMPMEERLKALKGLRIAVAGAGGSADFLVRHLAAAAGLSPESDLSLLYMNDSAGMLASFEADRIDGFALSSPTSDVAILSYGGKMLVDMAAGQYKPLAGYPSISLSAREDWLSGNRDKAVKFLRALEEADKMIHGDAKRAKAAVRERFALTKDDVFSAAWDANKASYPDTPEITLDSVKRAIDFLAGIQGEKIEGDPSAFFDTSYAEEALKN